MLRRLILASLIACLAFPAAAMPMLHGQMDQGPAAHPSMTMPAHHHATPAAQHDASHNHDGMTGQTHECIGCMARYDGVALPEARTLPVDLPRCVVAPAQIAGSGHGPETPPPRC